MQNPIQELQERIAPLRKQIIQHPLYSILKHPDDIRIFMQFHIYAVWDFMSLLKSLQQDLTCTQVPWFPVGDATTRYLINEIVLGEEADVDLQGRRKSHFELYLAAMAECGADSTTFLNFIEHFKSSKQLDFALQASKNPEAAAAFVRSTFQLALSNKTPIKAAVFTFGREDLIPKMFYSLVKDCAANFPNTLSTFNYYLERHIEVDGDHHSQLALQMTQQLCGDDAALWQEATTAVIDSLQMRIQLWDGAYQAIQLQQQNAVLV